MITANGLEISGKFRLEREDPLIDTFPCFKEYSFYLSCVPHAHPEVRLLHLLATSLLLTNQGKGQEALVEMFPEEQKEHSTASKNRIPISPISQGFPPTHSIGFHQALRLLNSDLK